MSGLRPKELQKIPDATNYFPLNKLRLFVIFVFLFLRGKKVLMNINFVSAEFYSTLDRCRAMYFDKKH